MSDAPAGPVLALDASTLAACAALLPADGGPATSWAQDDGKRGTAQLAPALARLLDDAGLAARDLGGVAVGTGPGSYTGLRAAIALARALALGAGLPVAGLPSVASAAAVALDADPAVERVVTLLDARRGEHYRADFARGAEDGTLVTAMHPCLVASAGLDELLTTPPPGVAVLTEPRPDPVWLARLAAARLAVGGDEPHTVLPLYLKRSHAEIALDERG